MSAKVTNLRSYRRVSNKTLQRRIEKTQNALRLRALEGQLDRVERGYQAAGRSRRWSRNWLVASGSQDEVSLEDRQELSDRASDLYRNSSIASGAINTICDNAIGNGLRLQSTIDREFLGLPDEAAESLENEIERRFHNWAASIECDAARRMNFYQIQQLAFKAYQIEGEAFALMPRFSRSGGIDRLRVQLVSARRCQSPMRVNDDSHRDGIDFNERGEPVFYHFSKRDGYFTGDFDFVKVPAFGRLSGRSNVLHIFRPDFIGQSRGVPILATIMEDIKQIDRYTKAELANAAVQALFTGFVKSNRSQALVDPFSGTSEESGEDRVQDYVLDSGAMYHLNPDEDVTFANPTRPTSGFGPFMDTYLTIIGMGLGLPHEVLVKKFNASFSASKAARIEAWRHYTLERRRFEAKFCEPIFREWMIESAAEGDFNLPGFFDSADVMNAFCSHQWFGDSQGQIDPSNETDAALKRIASGLSTRQIETAALGHDFEKNVRMLKRENKLLEDIGAIQMELFPGPQRTGEQEAPV